MWCSNVIVTTRDLGHRVARAIAQQGMVQGVGGLVIGLINNDLALEGLVDVSQ